MTAPAKRPSLPWILLALLLATSAVVLLSTTVFRSGGIKYGISPYQDTILPVVAESQGWYQAAGLRVQIKVVEWGEVMNAVAAGRVDVAIQNFNSFQAAYQSIVDDGQEVVFYYPLFVFRGAAIMVRQGSGLAPATSLRSAHPTQDAVKAAAEQLRGRTIFTTRGTEMEQIVLAALSRAGLTEADVRIVHAQPADGLNAFLKGQGDAYSGGVTERTEAARAGAYVLVDSADVSPPVIDGLVTTKQFAQGHRDELGRLVGIWFRTIQFIEQDFAHRALIPIDYLARIGSTKYTLAQYDYTWRDMEVFPRTPEEMEAMVLDEAGQYFWKRSWQANNDFLVAQRKIPRPVPLSAFLGDHAATR